MLRQSVRARPFCGRCGQEQDRLRTIKVEREDGHKLTMRVCDTCTRRCEER
jgi:hypothetical protein